MSLPTTQAELDAVIVRRMQRQAQTHAQALATIRQQLEAAHAQELAMRQAAPALELQQVRQELREARARGVRVARELRLEIRHLRAELDRLLELRAADLLAQTHRRLEDRGPR